MTWPTKKLGEICEFQFGFSFKASDFNLDKKGLPVIRIGDLESQKPEVFYDKNYDQKYLVKQGDILIGLSGTITVNIWKGPTALLNQRLVKLENFKNCDKKFIFYSLPKVLKELSEELTRSAVKNVLKHHLYNLSVPLPPLPIQQKIVKILDAIQEGVEVQEKIIEKTKELKKSLMADLFKYGLPAPRRNNNNYFVYVILCSNGSLYIGQTNDLLKRWQEHLDGKVSWTARYKPIKIVHYETYNSRAEAVKREKWLKTGFGRKWIKRKLKAGKLNPFDINAARQAGGPSFRKNRKLKKTEIGETPEDWEVVRLGDRNIAKVCYGKAKPPEDGDIPVIGSSGIYAKTNKALIEKPTLVIGRKGTAGMVHLSLTPSWPSDTTFYLNLNLERILPQFLYLFMSHHPISGEYSKTTLPSLKREDLENFQIPFPSLPEQQEIAEILQTVNQKIEIEQKKKTLYEELFKTMLNKIMNQEIEVESINFD